MQILEWPFGDQYFRGMDRDFFGRAVIPMGLTKQYVWAAPQASPPNQRSKLCIRPMHVRALQSVHQLHWERMVVANASTSLRLVHYLPHRWWARGPNPRGPNSTEPQRLQDWSMFSDDV